MEERVMRGFVVSEGLLIGYPRGTRNPQTPGLDDIRAGVAVLIALLCASVAVATDLRPRGVCSVQLGFMTMRRLQGEGRGVI
ncbi:hypothetical protein J6590_064536 [Homalodisca vitripennis]|nr:hypothetical protein J6590_064536 [Homalodisca vitripennis]